MKLIFTSPSSVDEVVDPVTTSNGQLKRRRGERRTRTHVAGILGMKKIAPRAIAYVAVQVSILCPLMTFGLVAIAAIRTLELRHMEGGRRAIRPYEILQ